MENQREDSNTSNSTSNEDSNGDLYSEAEKSLGLKIPLTIKNLLTVNGYEYANLISEINNETIAEMEDFARNELPYLISKDKYVDYYGLFSENPERFKLVAGHKKILNLFIQFCKEKVMKFKQNDSKHFNQRSKITHRSNPRGNQTHNESETDAEIHGPSISQASLMSVQDINLTEENKKILRGLKSWAEKKVPDKTKWLALSYSLDSMTVHTKICKDDLSANITCFCKSFYKIHRTSKKGVSGSNRWNLSNFQNHLSKKHFENSSCEKVHTRVDTIDSFLVPVKKPNSKINILQNAIICEPSINKIVNNPDRRQEHQETSYVTEKPSTSASESNIIGDHFLVGDIQTSETTSSQISCLQFSDIPNSPNSSSSLNNSYLPEAQSETFLEEDKYINQQNIQDDASDGPSGEQFENISKCSSKWKALKYQRSERGRRSREKSIVNQNLITDYFDIVNRICETVTPEITDTIFEKIKDSENVIGEAILETNKTFEGKKKTISCFLQKLLTNALDNSKHSNNKKNVFDDITKKIGIYLYYTAGRLAYETLYANLTNCLPSITTINRFLSETRIRIREGEFDFEGLASFLDKKRLPRVIWVSEDATRINGKIEYDSKSNEIVGFVLPLKNGVPVRQTFVATTADKIKECFQNNTKSSYAYVIVAQPLIPGAPSYCLACFGTDNRFTHHDVVQRWEHMISAAKENGITILGFSSDGDSRLLKSMRLKSGIFNLNTSDWKWFFMDIDHSEECYFQDFVHIMTKLRTRFLNEKISLKFGSAEISSKHLYNLLQTVSKDQHMLTLSDLKLEDKMNFLAAEKMCSPSIVNLLRKMEGTEGTVFYLNIMNSVSSAFLQSDISLSERLYKIWSVVFFLRIWRSIIKRDKEQTLKNNFISLNSYLCIELNAHMLIKLILFFKYKQIDSLEANMFLLSYMSSQPCEKLFRTARSMTSTFSTVINFSLKDLLHRIDRIRSVNYIICDIGGDFFFPREEKRQLAMIAPSEISQEDIIKLDIETIVDKALKDILNQIKEMDIFFEENDYFSIDILPTFDSGLDESSEKKSLMCIDTVHDISDPNYIYECDSEEEPVEYKTLLLKDYSESTTDLSPTSPFLKIKVKNKIAIIKKSSFCWLLDESNGRLSTDRLQRFISGKQKGRKERKSEVKRVKLDRQLSDPSDEESVIDEPLNDTHTEGTSFSNPSIDIEKYYAVSYDQQWYIGRVTEKIDDELFKLKFLKSELGQFKWPHHDDQDNVHKKFIFYGPIELIGTGPFQLKENDSSMISKKYKLWKKNTM